MMEYFIIENNGQQAGPFSLEQLVQKAITPETLVWAQGMKDWTPAWKIAELKTVLETVEAIKANTANKENAEGTSAFSYKRNRPEIPDDSSGKTQLHAAIQNGFSCNICFRKHSTIFIIKYFLNFVKNFWNIYFSNFSLVMTCPSC